MKKNNKVIPLLLFSLLAMLLFGQAVLAHETEVADVGKTIPTQLTFDKDSINDGEVVTATLTLENPSEAGFHQVSLSTALPAGLSADQANKFYDQIPSGQKITHSFKIQAGSAGASQPLTRDDFPTIILTLTLIGSCFLGVVFFKARSRQRQKMLSLILCFCLSTQLIMGLFAQRVLAEEDDALPTSIDDISYEVTGKLLVNGSEQTITSNINIGSISPLPYTNIEYEPLTTATTVAVSANTFEVIVSSQRAFAENLNPADIECANAFSEAKIESITPKDQYTLALKMSTPMDQEDESCGMIYFDAGCFADDSDKAGLLTVEVATPSPYFAQGPEAVGINEDDTAILSFCIDTAEFSESITIEHFTFDDPAIQPVDFFIPSTQTRRDGIITVRTEGVSNPSDIMDTLDGTTMTIDGLGLNSDTLSLTLSLEQDIIQPFLILNEVDIDPNNPNVATASFVGVVRSVKGSVDLTQGQTTIVNPLDNSAISTSLIDDMKDAFTFEITLDDNSLNDRYVSAGEGGARNFFLDWASYQNVSMPDNCVLDSYGVSVGNIQRTAYIRDAQELLEPDEGSPSARNSFVLANSSEIKDIANGYKNEEFDPRAHFNIAKKAVNCLANISKGLTSLNKGDVLQGLATLMGLVVFDDGGPTLKDISQGISDLDHSLQSLRVEVDSISQMMEDNRREGLEKQTLLLNAATGYISNKDKNTLAELTSLDNIESDECQGLIVKLCTDVEKGNGGPQGLIEKTLAVGKTMIGADGSKGMMTDTSESLKKKYNWKSQMASSTLTYWAYQYQSYIKGYMICMCYMQSNNENYEYTESIRLLEEQSQVIAKQWDALVKDLTLQDGQDQNLINGKYCKTSVSAMETDTAVENLLGYIYYCDAKTSTSTVFKNLPKERAIGNFMKPQKDLLTVDVLKEMERRLKVRNNSHFKSLYDEMADVGINLPSEYLYIGNESLSYGNRNFWISFFSFGGHARVTGHFKADLYNLKTNQSMKNVDLVTFTAKDWRDGYFFNDRMYEGYLLENYRKVFKNNIFVFQNM